MGGGLGESELCTLDVLNSNTGLLLLGMLLHVKVQKVFTMGKGPRMRVLGPSHLVRNSPFVPPHFLPEK